MGLIVDYSAAFRFAPARERHGVESSVQPLDASVLDPLQLEEWQRSFHWPVEDEAFEAFARAAIEGLIATTRALAPADAMVILSDNSFFGYLLQHLHLKAAFAAFEALDETPVAGHITSGYLKPDWQRLARDYDRYTGLWAGLMLRLRERVKTWVFNRHLAPGKRWRAQLPGCECRVLGSFAPLMAQYSKRKGEPVRHIYAATHLPRRAEARPLGAVATNSVRAFLENLDWQAQHHLGVRLEYASAFACWTRRLAILNGFAEALRRAGHAPGRLYLSNIGDTFHRLIAQVWREGGTEIIGFHHGNDMGAEPSFFTGLAEYGMCDVFVTPTEASATWLSRSYQCGPKLRDVRFVSAESDRYRTLRATLNFAPVNKIERVMIVAYPPNWIRYPGHAAHYSLMQLDMELTLARLLRAHGYKVAVKVHPEWQQLSETLWRGRADDLPRTPFERCWQQADAILFPRATSTAFGYALCTDRPIFVFDYGPTQWNAEAYELLKRRCVMIPAGVDAQNRITFDAGALLTALAAPVGPIDYGYVEYAMYPQPRLRGSAP